jgi:hypothetical protein
MRRVALLLIAAMVLGLVAMAGPAAAQKKVKSCQKDKKLNENIQAAFVPFFLGETSAERAATIENGEALEPILEQSTQAALAAGQTSAATATYPVSIDATCDGKKNATFNYDLALAIPKPVTNPPSTGIGLNFAGDAVLVKGKWVISGLTVCDLIGQNPNTPTLGAECQDVVLG